MLRYVNLITVLNYSVRGLSRLYFVLRYADLIIILNYSVRGFSRLYFTKVKLGSPPKEFNVQIDTGSDILWVTCSSCSNCPQNSGLGVRFCFFALLFTP